MAYVYSQTRTQLITVIILHSLVKVVLRVEPISFYSHAFGKALEVIYFKLGFQNCNLLCSLGGGYCPWVRSFFVFYLSLRFPFDPKQKIPGLVLLFLPLNTLKTKYHQCIVNHIF